MELDLASDGVLGKLLGLGAVSITHAAAHALPDVVQAQKRPAVGNAVFQNADQLAGELREGRPGRDEGRLGRRRGGQDAVAIVLRRAIGLLCWGLVQGLREVGAGGDTGGRLCASQTAVAAVEHSNPVPSPVPGLSQYIAHGAVKEGANLRVIRVRISQRQVQLFVAVAQSVPGKVHE
ncbi:hypothetical protein P1P70_35175 [Streptomyces sp. MB09-02B]|nr:hypothetical protein [Streptomyces sp. MB09-02B]MDX3644539.1 hypothetical protein [Streptomyces sp. MB09-02B]